MRRILKEKMRRFACECFLPRGEDLRAITTARVNVFGLLDEKEFRGGGRAYSAHRKRRRKGKRLVAGNKERGGRGNELKRNLTSSGRRGDERAKVKRCFPAFSFRGRDIGATQFH